MTSSVESQYGNENYTPYTASKWALQSLQARTSPYPFVPYFMRYMVLQLL